MNKSTIERTPDKTIKFVVTVEVDKVTKAREQILDELVKSADIKGFRKGKAPKEVVEKNIDEAKINEEVLRKIVPDAYLEAIKEHKISPIIQPKIQIIKFAKDNELVFNAETCEAPEIKLGDYKTKVKDITAKSKIIVPGKEKQEVKIDEVLKTILDSVKLDIPKVLLDQETDRLLSQTLDEIKKLGLTLDQYLSSTGKTSEVLRNEYEARAKNELSLEFILQEIAETEKIQVTQEELDKAISEIKDQNEREAIEKNKYIYATILRKQKTLDFIKSL